MCRDRQNSKLRKSISKIQTIGKSCLLTEVIGIGPICLLYRLIEVERREKHPTYTPENHQTELDVPWPRRVRSSTATPPFCDSHPIHRGFAR